MRKCIVLLVLVLVLAGCGWEPASATTPPSPPASQTPDPESVVSGGVVLPHGLLPQSAYEPSRPPERRYAEITHKLIPSDDYGRIWPYVGAQTTPVWTDGKLYGLCDADDRIICDPFYNEVEIIERDGNNLLMLTKNGVDEEGAYAPAVMLATLDGSWVGEYENVLHNWNGLEVAIGGVYDWCEPMVYEYVTVCKNRKWGVIDYQGHEVLPCVYNAPLCFSEGFAAALSDDEKTYNFIDETGSVIHGPYETPPRQEHPHGYSGRSPLPLTHGLVYREGRARFYVDGKYGIIDRAGEVIVSAQYDFITPYFGGTAQFTVGGGTGVIDRDGTVLLEPTERWLERNYQGVVLFYEAGERVELDPMTGEHKPWTEPDLPDCKAGLDGVTIKWLGGELRFPEASGVVSLDNGGFALTFGDDKETWIIVDRSGETVAGPFDGRAYQVRNGIIDVSYHHNGLGTAQYGMTWYDETGHRLLPETYLQVRQFDSWYLVRQQVFAGLLDENGDWVIKIPLYEYMGD